MQIFHIRQSVQQALIDRCENKSFQYRYDTFQLYEIDFTSVEHVVALATV